MNKTRRPSPMVATLGAVAVVTGALTAYTLTGPSGPGLFGAGQAGEVNASPSASSSGTPTPRPTYAAPSAWPTPGASLPPTLGANSQVGIPMPTPTPTGPPADVHPGDVVKDSKIVLPTGMALWQQPDKTYLVTSPAAGMTDTVRSQLASTIDPALQTAGGDRVAQATALSDFSKQVNTATGTQAVVVHTQDGPTSADSQGSSTIWVFWVIDGTNSSHTGMTKTGTKDDAIAAAKAWIAKQSGKYELVVGI